MASRNRFCRQYLQKVNAKCPQISDEKKRVLSLWEITFDPLKKEKKNIYQCKKNLSFSSEIWGHFAFTFCRYLNQNMRAFTFCRYCPPIVFCPQIWKTKRTQKSRAITLNFWDEVFSLSMPSVCPRLTAVFISKYQIQGSRNRYNLIYNQVAAVIFMK